MTEVLVHKLPHFDSSFPLPTYESVGAAGADVRVSLKNKDQLEVAPGTRVLVPTGLSFEIPTGFEIQVRPRSGLSLKSDLLIPNAPGTIDSDYRGEVMIIVGNFGQKTHIIHHGDRIAQFVLAPVYRAHFKESSDLSETTRSKGGFGSTGGI